MDVDGDLGRILASSNSKKRLWPKERRRWSIVSPDALSSFMKFLIKSRACSWMRMSSRSDFNRGSCSSFLICCSRSLIFVALVYREPAWACRGIEPGIRPSASVIVSSSSEDEAEAEESTSMCALSSTAAFRISTCSPAAFGVPMPRAVGAVVLLVGSPWRVCTSQPTPSSSRHWSLVG